MKKYSVKLASLILFFVTNAVIGMRPPQVLKNVYLENQLTSRTEMPHEIKAIVTYKNGSTQEIIIEKPWSKKLLGDIDTITRIQITRHLTGTLGQYGPLGLTKKMFEKFNASVDDITDEFLAFTENTTRPQGPDMIITVKWKFPESNTDFAWRYSFSTGTVGYPWNWVVNNTSSEIQIKEIIDPNSLYAQEMAEEGLTVGNPVKIAPGQRWEIFETNKRFQVYSNLSRSWFEPDYAYLEKQVNEGRKANPGKIPAISIGSKCLGCGWSFQIIWVIG